MDLETIPKIQRLPLSSNRMTGNTATTTRKRLRERQRDSPIKIPRTTPLPIEMQPK
uniref:Uncharacterized protein n=1 Tax=Picea sitchensis TaxID=3332 RepID=A9NMB6_PICSI|nr:unknown [Picea sitchensis]